LGNLAALLCVFAVRTFPQKVFNRKDRQDHEKKVALIVKENPTWEDPAADWGEPAAMRKQKQVPPLPLRLASE
jgi:hypothetical protein